MVLVDVMLAKAKTKKASRFWNAFLITIYPGISPNKILRFYFLKYDAAFAKLCL